MTRGSLMPSPSVWGGTLVHLPQRHNFRRDFCWHVAAYGQRTSALPTSACGRQCVNAQFHSSFTDERPNSGGGIWDKCVRVVISPLATCEASSGTARFTWIVWCRQVPPAAAGARR